MGEELGKCALCNRKATHKPQTVIFEFTLESGEKVHTLGFLEKPVCDKHFKEFLESE